MPPERSTHLHTELHDRVSIEYYDTQKAPSVFSLRALVSLAGLALTLRRIKGIGRANEIGRKKCRGAAVARAPFIDGQAPWRDEEWGRGMRPRRAMTAPGSLPLREARAVVLQPIPLRPLPHGTAYYMALAATARAFRSAVR
ncbi:unnamed protein product [Pieris brassicae]|uniref:Uncharacterized protein n=1 Tax=Pieris brassicae TaxID=7116 RepID=A0A9P0U0E7_PIEBR|nr:unnamed protein product [Pieris brassicae]